MDPKDISERIELIISQLVTLKTELQSGEPVFPAWAQELVEQRICLVCKKKIALTDTPNRGNHERHYRKVKRAIDRGELTEAQAISEGILAPAKSAGRPRKSLADEISKSAVVDAAQLISANREKSKKKQGD